MINAKRIVTITDNDADGLTCCYLLKEIYKEQIIFRHLETENIYNFISTFKKEGITTLIYADCFPEYIFDDVDISAIDGMDVIIYDHHKTYHDKFCELCDDYYTSNVDGFILIKANYKNISIKYYYSQELSATGILCKVYGIKETKFLKYVNDNDVWNHKSIDNYYFGIGIKNKIGECINTFNSDLDMVIIDAMFHINKYVEQGRLIYSNIINDIDKNIDLKNYDITMDKFGNTVLVCSFITMDTTIQLKHLYHQFPNIDYAMVYINCLDDDKIKVIMRSDPNKVLVCDCSIIAKKMSGNGNKHSAKFYCDSQALSTFLPHLKNTREKT